MEPIELRGARHHNLEGIDLDIRPGELLVITGPSGAGKSSLALDTLYAEGQRRFVESFSPYARQFLQRIKRPRLDSLESIPPAIAVDRAAPTRTGRSTVATRTEIADYIKILFSTLGQIKCEECGRIVRRDRPEEVADELVRNQPGMRAVVWFPWDCRDDVEDLVGIQQSLLPLGFSRVFGGGKFKDLEELRPSDLSGFLVDGSLRVVADRLAIEEESRPRIVEALEAAMQRGGGRAGVSFDGSSEAILLSSRLRCDQCSMDYSDPAPGLFSFNSPLGACPGCSGFGRSIELDPTKIVDDPDRSIRDEAIKPFRGKKRSWERRELLDFCEGAGIPTDVPWQDLSSLHRGLIIDGDKGNSDWWGVRAWFDYLETRSYKMHVRILLARYRRYVPCPDCGGRRFAPASLTYRVEDHDISEFYALSSRDAHEFIDRLSKHPSPAVRILVFEVLSRLNFLCDVGLGYLTLDRMTRSLSGGEAQRVGLATALGASLSETLFVIDEPTIGLHPSDAPPLVDAVRRLVDAGNPTLVVDNHEAFVTAADRLVDIGPGAGAAGGRLVFDGPPSELVDHESSPTAALLRETVPEPRQRRQPTKWAKVVGARAHNLRNIDVEVPLEVLTVITGPSGSGKSTLIEHVLVRGLRRQRGEQSDEPGAYDGLVGFERVDDLVVMDQSPLGRTSRGNPATYTKAWDVFRRRLASTDLAKDLGFGASTFSFNVDGGRCETCRGEGVERIEMQFLPDIDLPCPACAGRRFTDPVLTVTLEEMNVAELLAASVDRLLGVFSADKLIKKRLEPVAAVGLGYLPLGQPLNTLSEGEAQRLKLARALSTVKSGSLVILDEPSAGLHPVDVEPLLAALHQLVRKGATVLVVEHDLSIAAAADWVIDLGPGAGDEGGQVISAGPPEEVARCAVSKTAPYLEKILAGRPLANPTRVEKAVDGELAQVGSQITVHGAREHNLEDVTVEIPRGKVCVVTGPSGSGKSSLAFDVVHAEGQRRYLQSLSPFVRQYLRQLPRPDVDRVEGIPPSIALEPRKAGAKGATVATLTEVSHYLRLLFSRVGLQQCPTCQIPVEKRSGEEVVGAVEARLDLEPASLLARVVHNRKGTHKDVFLRAAKLGFERARVDGKWVSTSPIPKLARYTEHDVDLEVAQIKAGDHVQAAVERALQVGGGSLRMNRAGEDLVLSLHRSCPKCGSGFSELDPTLFSPTSRHGACPDCAGSGVETVLDENAVFVEGLPLDRGGLRLLEIKAARGRLLTRLRRLRSIPLDQPIEELTEAQRRWLIEGKGKWRGLLRTVEMLVERGIDGVEEMLTRGPCSTCQGSSLSEQPRNVLVRGSKSAPASLPQLLVRSISGAREWLEQLTLDERSKIVGEQIRIAVVQRLSFLEQTGVGYLTLDRPVGTLSGGETQRVRLAAQLGAGLSGVCYVLDEPTIGLHPRDTGRLLEILRRLAAGGSTVLVVEHDEQTIRGADHIIDLGPGGGRHGGRIVDQGTPAEVEARGISPTGRVLHVAARETAAVPARLPISDTDRWLTVRGAAARNLDDIDVSIPVARLSVVSGVSGSGKSTLVREVLWRSVKRALGLKVEPPGRHVGLDGHEQLLRAVEVDQSPIGRTPRSVPATYVGIWNDIRQLLAKTPEARARGYGPERFSFNRKSGRCDVCDGQGAVKVEMSFLPDVLAPCEACLGTRFDRTTRDITYRSFSVDRMLGSTVDEALELFEAFPRITRKLQLLQDLGLGYLQLGQPSNTLSGGEAQRMKLTAEFGARSVRKSTLYVLDEPTTGLHLNDVSRLLKVLRKLVERGDTVVVIEHHPEVIWAADYVIDLGPEGGDGGGRIVAEGTPEVIRDCESSHTGAALREMSLSRVSW